MPSSPREIPHWRVVLALVLLLGVAILALDALYVMAFGANAPHWLQLLRRRLQGEWAFIQPTVPNPVPKADRGL